MATVTVREQCSRGDIMSGIYRCPKEAVGYTLTPGQRGATRGFWCERHRPRARTLAPNETLHRLAQQ